MVPDPTRRTEGGVVSAGIVSSTLIVRVADPVFPAASTLRYSIVYEPVSAVFTEPED